MSTHSFLDACIQYKYLREAGYPEQATLKLVGDRHRLSRIERNCLFRGVVAESLAEERRNRIVAPGEVAGRSLGIDWYNVLIMVESYLRGQPVFVAEDGVTRDSSATHGSYRRSPLTVQAIEGIVDAVVSMGPSRIDAFLDAPVAHSGLMADELRERLLRIPCPARVTLDRSADFPLKSYDGIVASSDSVILDSAVSILDLPRLVLSREYGVTLPGVRDLFPSSPEAPRRWSGIETPDPQAGGPRALP
jgi:hypothetical protein